MPNLEQIKMNISKLKLNLISDIDENTLKSVQFI